MISITWIFFIIEYKYKDDGGMKKGLNRFAGLKFNGLMLEVLFVLKERFKRLEIPTPNAKPQTINNKPQTSSYSSK